MPESRVALRIDTGPGVHVQQVAAAVEGRTSLTITVSGPHRHAFRLVAEPLEPASSEAPGPDAALRVRCDGCGGSGQIEGAETSPVWHAVERLEGYHVVTQLFCPACYEAVFSP